MYVRRYVFAHFYIYMFAYVYVYTCLADDESSWLSDLWDQMPVWDGMWGWFPANIFSQLLVSAKGGKIYGLNI